ncbi:MAG: hypothetical protein LIO41_04575 [Ruminococcus sp.]|nr:hypothetical protein [Ruminococcus sp.]
MKKFAKIDCLKKVYHYFWQKKRDRQSVEKHVVKRSGIENDKMIYIIRRVEKCGFFSNYFFVLGHIIYALNNNYIPVVDMENYMTLYSEHKELHGTKNAWEYYFYQPIGKISLECAYESKEYILSSGLYQYDLVPFYVGKPGEHRFPTPI